MLGTTCPCTYRSPGTRRPHHLCQRGLEANRRQAPHSSGSTFYRTRLTCPGMCSEKTHFSGVKFPERRRRAQDLRPTSASPRESPPSYLPPLSLKAVFPT